MQEEEKEEEGGYRGRMWWSGWKRKEDTVGECGGLGGRARRRKRENAVEWVEEEGGECGGVGGRGGTDLMPRVSSAY